ncbi:hypothetical protein [uncultured Campylobacter sp.]|uniref:hypothetical protein n=1 Tax=uncultured Campylobacter sp. TaxID=218934 RepID=UPI002625C64A|nr:hypothetical protein [uncultured Campylobacter sp.]
MPLKTEFASDKIRRYGVELIYFRTNIQQIEKKYGNYRDKKAQTKFKPKLKSKKKIMCSKINKNLSKIQNYSLKHYPITISKKN